MYLKQIKRYNEFHDNVLYLCNQFTIANDKEAECYYTNIDKTDNIQPKPKRSSRSNK